MYQTKKDLLKKMLEKSLVILDGKFKHIFTCD